MTLKLELSKIRNSFSKVREDMLFLSKHVSENYEHFLKEHSIIEGKITKLSDELKEHINYIKKEHIQTPNPDASEINYLREQIKELKEEVSNTHKEHFNLSKVLEDISKNKKNIKEMKEKLHSSELEIFLLKEKLSEKDLEIKQIKDVSKTIFNIVDELSKVELEMLNVKSK